jgi:hypothetical protein
MNHFRKFWTKWHQPAILLFLLWHFSGVLLWDSPDCPLKDKLITPFLSYLNFFGLWQGWSVFETPRTYNEYLTADVTFKDGSRGTFEFPRMEKLNLAEKMFKEKFRRWANDCLCDESMSYLWPDAARYVARQYKGQGTPPVSVTLVRHWIWIDPPDIGLTKPLRTTGDGEQKLYTCAIDAKELQ